MHLLLLSVTLLMSQPVADPAYFAYNSPQCVVQRLWRGNPLPLIVRTQHPPCPWNSDEAAMVEVGRQFSIYSWWNFERTRNLELAAAKIDGTMLLPGEEFSYNETVGERTEESGFKEAKVIVDYGYTDDIGGGVCQPASTLYAAALRAGLDITERWPHRFRVKYVPLGLDATVDWGKKDLKMVNNTPFPLVIQMGKVEKGELLVRLMAPVRTFRVKYKYNVVAETPSDTVRFSKVDEVEDVVEYYGRPGIEIEKTIWRRNLLTDKLEKVRVRNDEYLPSPWTLRVTQYPGGRKVHTGLSVAQINKFLAGTRYTVESARFSDIMKLNDQYLRKSYVPRRKLRAFQRFSNIEKYVELAAIAAGTP